MIGKIGHITILVKNQDEAVSFYTQALGFLKQNDALLGNSMRWITVSPPNQTDLQLTLVLADTPAKQAAVGKQAGDHVLFTMETDNCQQDYRTLKSKGVKFWGKPEKRPYGTEVVFEDLYGNLCDLIERTEQNNI
jgi:catechol 2,3-dioxygenase-like lactoylglutathione lyase family enzyme